MKQPCWHMQCKTPRPQLVHILVPEPDMCPMFPRNLGTIKRGILVQKREVRTLPQFHHHPLLVLAVCLTKVLFVWLLLCLCFCMTRLPLFGILLSYEPNYLHPSTLILSFTLSGYYTRKRLALVLNQKSWFGSSFSFSEFNSSSIFKVNISNFVITVETKWVLPCVLSVYDHESDSYLCYYNFYHQICNAV